MNTSCLNKKELSIIFDSFNLSKSKTDILIQFINNYETKYPNNSLNLAQYINNLNLSIDNSISMQKDSFVNLFENKIEVIKDADIWASSLLQVRNTLIDNTKSPSRKLSYNLVDELIKKEINLVPVISHFFDLDFLAYILKKQPQKISASIGNIIGKHYLQGSYYESTIKKSLFIISFSEINEETLSYLEKTYKNTENPLIKEQIINIISPLDTSLTENTIFKKIPSICEEEDKIIYQYNFSINLVNLKQNTNMTIIEIKQQSEIFLYYLKKLITQKYKINSTTYSHGKGKIQYSSEDKSLIDSIKNELAIYKNNFDIIADAMQTLKTNDDFDFFLKNLASNLKLKEDLNSLPVNVVKKNKI